MQLKMSVAILTFNDRVGI